MPRGRWFVMEILGAPLSWKKVRGGLESHVVVVVVVVPPETGPARKQHEPACINFWRNLSERNPV